VANGDILLGVLGIFIGFISAAILLTILYVAMQSITGLQVSYFAFTSEMGPNAQKKSQ